MKKETKKPEQELTEGVTLDQLIASAEKVANKAKTQPKYKKLIETAQEIWFGKPPRYAQ